LSKFIYGIDFGTSNSVLAILDTEKNEVVKTIGENSIIYFKDEKELYIGKLAIQKYIQNNQQGRLLKSIKTLLPQPNFTFTYIFGKKYTAEDLIVLILSYLKKQADEFVGEDIQEVVMGRPVVFSEDKEKDQLAEKRLLNATRKAGFEKIWFQYEPIAAGFLYEQSIQKPELVLIGDFGGGTSDFTLMKLKNSRVSQGQRKEDILKTGGIHIGGDDIDAAIMWNKLVPYFGYGLKYDSYGKSLDLPVHIFRTLCEWEQMAFLKEGNLRRSLDTYYLYTNRNEAIQRLMTLIDKNLGFSLFQSIEKAKINLSDAAKSEIHFHHYNIEIDELLVLDELNRFIQPDIQKIETFILNFMKSLSISTGEINNIFLTGGTSSLSAVRSIFERIFSKEKLREGDNFNSVAQGLALSYNFLKT
jgi:hypothetical chaperone protein